MSVSNHPLSPEDLMAYLDGELAANDMSQAAGHLAHCRECQASAAELQALSGELTAWEVSPPNPDAAQCPQAAPGEKPDPFWLAIPSFWTRFRVQSIVAVVTIPLLVVACVDLFRIKRPPATQSTEGSISAQMVHPGDRVVPYGVADAPQTENSGGRPRASLQGLFSSAGGAGLQSAAKPATVSMVARTAELRMTVKDFGPIRDSVMRVVKLEEGYLSRLVINQPSSGGHTLFALLQVPSQRLDAVLSALKHLGNVESESQTGEDVSKQVVDVDARLGNLRSEEARLNQIMKERTGKLADVLAVEEQISNVRGQIEGAQAEQKNLAGRVRFASLEVTVTEEYTKTLANNEAPSISTRLHNAAIEGIERLQNLVVGTLMFFLTYGLSLLLASGVIFLVFKLGARYRRMSR